MFTSDPSVLMAGTMYLRIVGPFYGFFGLGLALYFASQGAGRLRWPLIAGFIRLTLAAVGGYVVTRGLGLDLPWLFAVMALALVAFGTINALAVRAGAWR
jgi:Na+-driven multidrug efflux pump